MMTSVDGLHGGLAALGDTLEVERIGPMHQAGSDSLLTAQTFFALIQRHLGPTLDEKKFKGQLFGLGDNHTKRQSNKYGSATFSPGTMQITGGVHYGNSNVGLQQYMYGNGDMNGMDDGMESY